ncbi:hypothetical protein PRUPE_7G044000 [Prunus persica]|uniref:Uncharacterized protein n=1 Tax=Prunus persica TaxID=3760 RepID=A0A251N6L9_PRUPE|nr:hypothetical protein PRUPE_7G044000 [Prunus persica]
MDELLLLPELFTMLEKSRTRRTATDGNDNGKIVDAMQYLMNILSSEVYDVAIESSLELATKVSERLGVRVWMKREDL